MYALLTQMKCKQQLNHIPYKSNKKLSYSLKLCFSLSNIIHV